MDSLVIQDLRFRNLEFGNDNKSIGFALLIFRAFQTITLLPGIFSKVILNGEDFSLDNFLKWQSHAPSG